VTKQEKTVPGAFDVKVLIIDDSTVDRTLMVRLLNRKGVRTVEAKDATEALPLLSNGSFSHLLIDWSMPGLSAVELVQYIREQSWGATCKIVMVTGNNELEQVRTALAAGVDEYVMKPLTAETFREKLALVGLELGPSCHCEPEVK
jgi:two-component system chemotaxis response regulator CheY